MALLRATSKTWTWTLKNLDPEKYGKQLDVEEWLEYRPLNSHCFTMCHTVSLHFSQSHGRFFIFHDFINFKWIFSQTYNFLIKQTRQHSYLLVKTYCNLSSTDKKIHNSIIFDSETSTRGSPGNDCPVNYQNLYEKHLSSISLTKSVPFWDSFCNNLEIF